MCECGAEEKPQSLDENMFAETFDTREIISTLKTVKNK